MSEATKKIDLPQDNAALSTEKELAKHRGDVSIEVSARALKKKLGNGPLGKLDLSKTNINELIRLLSRVDQGISAGIVDKYLGAAGNYVDGNYVFAGINWQTDRLLSGDTITGEGLGYTSNGRADRTEQEQVYNAILAYRKDTTAQSIVKQYAQALENGVGVVGVDALEATAALTKSADITPQKAAEGFSNMYQEGILNRDGFVKLYSQLLSTPDGVSTMAQFLGIKAASLADLWTEYQKSPAQYAPRLRFVVQQAAAMKNSLSGASTFGSKDLLSVLKGDFLKDAERTTTRIGVAVDQAMDKAFADAKARASDGAVDPKERAAIQEAIKNVEMNRATYVRKAISHISTNFFALHNPNGRSAVGVTSAFDVHGLKLQIGAIGSEGGKWIPTVALPIHGTGVVSKTAESTTTFTGGPTVGYAERGFITLDGTLTTTKNIQFVGGGMQAGESASFGASVGKGFGTLMLSTGENRLNTIQNYTATIANVLADALVNASGTTVSDEQLRTALKSNGLSSEKNVANIAALKDSLNRYTAQLGMPANAGPGLRVVVANQAARFMLEQLVADEAANTKENKSSGGISFGIGAGPSFILPIFGFNLYEIKQAYVKVKSAPAMVVAPAAPAPAASATAAPAAPAVPAVPAPTVESLLDLEVDLGIDAIAPNLLHKPGMKNLFLAMRTDKNFREFQRLQMIPDPRALDFLEKALVTFARIPKYKALANTASAELKNSKIQANSSSELDALDQTLAASNALTSGDQLSRRTADILAKLTPAKREAWINANPKTIESVRKNRFTSAIASIQFPEAKAAFEALYASANFKKSLVNNPEALAKNAVAFVGYDQTLGAAKGIDMLPTGANLIGKMAIDNPSSATIDRLLFLFEKNQAKRFNRGAVNLQNIIEGTKEGINKVAKSEMIDIFRSILKGESVELKDGRKITAAKPDVFASLAVINGAACYNAILGFTPKAYAISRLPTPKPPAGPAPVTPTVPSTPTIVDDVFADISLPEVSQSNTGFWAAVVVNRWSETVTQQGGAVTRPGENVGDTVVPPAPTAGTSGVTTTAGGRQPSIVGSGTPITPVAPPAPIAVPVTNVGSIASGVDVAKTFMGASGLITDAQTPEVRGSNPPVDNN
jgi:hypothetical protein